MITLLLGNIGMINAIINSSEKKPCTSMLKWEIFEYSEFCAKSINNCDCKLDSTNHIQIDSMRLDIFALI